MEAFSELLPPILLLIPHHWIALSSFRVLVQLLRPKLCSTVTFYFCRTCMVTIFLASETTHFCSLLNSIVPCMRIIRFSAMAVLVFNVVNNANFLLAGHYLIRFLL